MQSKMILSKISHSVIRTQLLKTTKFSTVSSVITSRFLPESNSSAYINYTASNTSTSAIGAAGASSIHLQKANFAKKSKAAAPTLSSILEQEINEEVTENQTLEMPDELAQLKREIEASWRIVDAGVSSTSSSSALTRMYKKEATQNGSKVMVEFHCQDTEELDGENPFNEGDQQEVEELSAHTVNFTVTVSRAGKSMIIDCGTEESEIAVGSVRVEDTDGTSDVTNSSATSKGSSNVAEYQGPVFRELAEDLQESFMSYVQEECGVTSDVAIFISMYADYKEQVQYTNWLKEVHTLVK